MKNNRITLMSSQDRELRDWLGGHPEGHERGAIILFRRLARRVNNQPVSDRFLAVEIIKMDDDWVLESSPTHLKFRMGKLPEIYFRCEKEGLELGFIHNHSQKDKDFSSLDEKNECTILHGLAGCNGKNAFLVAMILHENSWYARVRRGVDVNTVFPVKHICVIGDRMELHGIATPEEATELQKRQEAAFGKPFNSKLKSLRVAVVGAGGTGSPIATLLARAGVGELIIIDGDTLAKSNMNRVRGYRTKDIGKSKAKTLASFINSIGVGVSVSAVNGYLNESAEAVDALSSADIVMGCTDDLAGRDLMNQAVYYYGQALIDVGLTGKIDVDKNGEPYLSDHRGRVSCILPEAGACLRCQRVLTEKNLEHEEAIKTNPELAKLDPITLEKDYYLIGGGEQAPGVGAFTSATANNAVATLMDLIKPFRKLPSDLRPDNTWTDFIHMNIYSNAPDDDAECIYCRKRLLLLKQEKKHRLDMPKLGKINDSV